MQPPDPTERFKGVTEIDFAVNEEAPLSEFKTARVLVRFDGVKKAKWCLLILKVRLRARALACLRLISVAGERGGLPCDSHQLCHPGLIYNMSAYTQRENAHARSHITTNLVLICLWLHLSTSPDGLRDTAAVFQDPCGQPCDETLIIAFCTPGEWRRGGVTLWWAGRSAGEAIDPRPIVEMVQYPHLLQWPLKQAHGSAHTQEWESYWDGQRCHQWLPSCHSDMERLGPYERLCSPKRYLGAGAAETRQWLLMRGHNQMWKLSCTLTGSTVAKGTVILMPFSSG